MSIAVTCRAILAMCRVNHPSPEHRSTTSMPERIPTAASTAAGSGHSASHHPAEGISVASKKPDSSRPMSAKLRHRPAPGSRRFARHAWISVDLETTCVLFAACTLEGVDRRTDLDFDEPDVFQHFLPGCTRQTTGNSSRPKIDVLDGRFGHRLAVRDIRKLQASTGAQDAEDFRERGFLVGAKVDHAVADHDICPIVL